MGRRQGRTSGPSGTLGTSTTAGRSSVTSGTIATFGANWPFATFGSGRTVAVLGRCRRVTRRSWGRWPTRVVAARTISRTAAAPASARSGPVTRSVAVTVASRSPALGCVGHHDVGYGLGTGKQFDAFPTRVKGRRRLGGHHGDHLEALHVLLDIGPVDTSDDRATRHEVDVQHPLGHLRAGGAPRGDLTLQTSNFDLDATRHRATIYSVSSWRIFH